MIDPGLAAVIAACVSLLLGLASIWRSAFDSRRADRRERQQRRAEAYVKVLRIVETRGLAVQDEMYNYTETGDTAYDVYAPTLPKRDISMPDRNDRAEARALLAAFGTVATRQAFEKWLAVVVEWEDKLAGWHYDNDVNGPPELQPDDAEPYRANELAARSALGEAVSSEVVFPGRRGS
ncbi:hypothetical protein [Zhihengliuella sp. ISTPL4]|uniref:hypothetical protein n=1 Tax=Zhihengliuella sp. ISTPL4 TaxID=2058657 RepID=UPI001305073E|nr:hypothetical protein [Zhihengliuella sp. ISTPL4]